MESPPVEVGTEARAPDLGMNEEKASAVLLVQKQEIKEEHLCERDIKRF